MDGATLRRRTRDSGLRVATEGGQLVVRGPRDAEPVALLLIAHKSAVIAALAADWHARHREALAWWGAFRSLDEAAQLAWGELEDRWHRLHGTRVPEWQCAGCGELIGGVVALDLADGARVHVETLNCVLRYGEHWRGAATEALSAMGLEPPTTDLSA